MGIAQRHTLASRDFIIVPSISQSARTYEWPSFLHLGVTRIKRSARLSLPAHAKGRFYRHAPFAPKRQFKGLEGVSYAKGRTQMNRPFAEPGTFLWRTPARFCRRHATGRQASVPTHFGAGGQRIISLGGSLLRRVDWLKSRAIRFVNVVKLLLSVGYNLNVSFWGTRISFPILSAKTRWYGL